MTLPILTVVGATGTQGASVVSALVQAGATPAYHIRALTSNVSSESAKQLAKHPNVTVAHVDINSVQSLEEAFKDSHAIFGNTVFSQTVFVQNGPDATRALEEQHGLNIVHAAAKIPSLKHLVWSTLPDSFAISKGIFSVPHFVAKIPAEKFIKDPANGLADKSSFLQVGMYGNNLSRPPYRPIWIERAKKFLFVMPCSALSPIAFIGDEHLNVGLFVKAILNQPEKTIGRFVLGSAETLSCRDWAASFTEALRRTGKHPDAECVYVESSLTDFVKLWGAGGLELGLMMGYYGAHGMEGWQGHPGSEPVLTAKDLGIEKDLNSVADLLARLDTNWYLPYDLDDVTTLV